MNKMARGIMAGVGVALIVLSVLMMAGVVHAAEPETRATTQASQWVLVQNLTFDDTSLNTFGVNGDTQNLSVSISGGYLNLSMKSPLIEDTQVWFFGFKPGPAKWVIKYEAHNASYTHLWIDGTRIWAMHAMETYDKNGNKIINYTHTDDKDQATIFIFNESKHITAYLNGVEVANVTDHTQFYMVPDANIMTMWNPTYIIFHSNTPASGWVKIDYIAEYVKTDPDYHLGATNYFFNRWDDGADSFFANGFNEFKNRGWYGTMSVITGKDNWTNISKLAAAGWELADHTRDHLNLQSLNISQAEQEISDGNADLNAHGYNVSVWTAPYGSRNITLDQYAYNELGLRDIYVFNYWYYANSEMNFWEKWANHSEYYGAALGHQVMNTALTDPAYISSANFSKTINYIVQKRLFVVGFSQLWDMIENSLHGTITEQNTTDVKKFSVSGVGEWAEVAVKGDYTGYNITDGHGNKLWNFYKDGYTYILIKLDETKASYSGVVMIDPSSPTSSAPAGTTNPTGGLQLNFTPLNIMLFIVGIGMVAASRRRW